jgi:hypothetical protein
MQRGVFKIKTTGTVDLEFHAFDPIHILWIDMVYFVPHLPNTKDWKMMQPPPGMVME